MRIDHFFRHRRAMPVPTATLCLLATIVLGGCAGTPPMSPPAAPPRQPAIPAPSATASPPGDAADPLARAPGPAAERASLARRIDAYIAQPRFAAASWGIDVVSLDSGRVLYAHDAGKLAIPASNTKLYTAALALSTLGSDERIRTSLYATAAPRDGVIDGNLILYGRGDPTLGSGSDTQTPVDWADQMAAALASRGVTRVHGAIIADDTWFSGPRIGPGWEALDLQNWYAPPASALTVQGNMFILEVGPSHGLCCEVSTTPTRLGLDIVNLTQTNPDAGWGDLGLYRPPGSRQLYVYGAMRPHAKSRSFPLAAPDPARMAGELLLEGLARHGIHVDGGVHTLHWPRTDDAIGAPGTIEIVDVASPPLGQIVHHTLKHSDNLYAELLLLQAGARIEHAGDCPDRDPAPHTTLGWALCGMRAMLARAGIPPRHALIGEGSGLSRKDLVTPRATATLLAWAARQPFAAVFRDALPIAGVDGTLKRRMRHTVASGDVHAKTGTLRYSYTLSGYATTATGQHLAFSLMLDRYAQPTDAMGHRTGSSPQHDLDAIAEMLAASGDTVKPPSVP